MKDIKWPSMSVNPRNTHAEFFMDAIQDPISAHIVITTITRFRPGIIPSLLDLIFTNEVNTYD